MIRLPTVRMIRQPPVYVPSAMAAAEETMTHVGTSKLSAVRWGVAGNIAIAWTLTLPASALIGALAYGVSSIFGSGALGPLVVSVSILGAVLAFFGRRVARGQVLTADA